MSGFFARTVALTRAILLRKPLSKICPNSSTGIISIWSTPGSVCTVTARNIHLSSQSRGLDEFFPLTDDIIEEGERSGIALRQEGCIILGTSDLVRVLEGEVLWCLRGSSR